VPAQHPPHRRDPAERQVRRQSPALGNGSGTGPRHWPRTATRLQGGGRAHGDLPHRSPPGLRAPAAAVDARGLRLRRGAHRRRGQRGRRLPRQRPAAPRLLTGSHYDTVRNGGKYDGRLGILVPMAACASCTGRPAPALRHRGGGLCRRGRPALQGHLPGQRRAHRRLRPGLAGPAPTPTACACATRCAPPACPPRCRPSRRCKRDPARYLGFVEVHIEQGPVLNELDLPLGVVTSINGSVRYLGEVIGQASHAGTTPMDRRRDAACAGGRAGAVRRARAGAVPDVVGTVGQLQVPAGSINVVPGRCRSAWTCAPPPTRRATRWPPTCATSWPHLRRRGLQLHAGRDDGAAPHPAHPAWQRAGRPPCRPWACRCTACPAAPGTTR
jgi:N-carbamoyl-L-amino-acid hydrolase